MLKDKLNKYRPSIDPALSEDGQMLGINLISNVTDPAVRIRGVAYNNHPIKDLKFADSKKLRIAAPVLVPDEIYRNEEDEQYYMVFTPEDIEILAKDFMSRLPTRGTEVFNLEHGEQMVDSYLLETILVDSDIKASMIKTDYGISVPIGTFFIVQQFNDEKVYNDIVERGATSFSFEGFLGTELINEYKFKEEKMKNLKLSKMKSPKKIVGVKRVMLSASKKVKMEEIEETEDLILIAEEYKEGADVVVIEDVVEGAVEDFTGEVDVTVEGKEEVLIIEDGVITEVVEAETDEVAEAEEVVETEMEEDKEVSGETKEVKAEEEDETKEVKLEEEVVVEEVVTSPSELDEIYKMIAEIKAELAELKATVPVDEDVIDDVLVREERFTNALNAFNKIKRK